MPTYRVELGLRRLSMQAIEVLAHAEEPFVLLGRDILNRHRLLLDGPNLALVLD